MLFEERKRLERTREKTLRAYYATEDKREQRILQNTLYEIDSKLDASKSGGSLDMVNPSSATGRHDEELLRKTASAGGAGSKDYPY